MALIRPTFIYLSAEVMNEALPVHSETTQTTESCLTFRSPSGLCCLLWKRHSGLILKLSKGKSLRSQNLACCILSYICFSSVGRNVMEVDTEWVCCVLAVFFHFKPFSLFLTLCDRWSRCLLWDSLQILQMHIGLSYTLPLYKLTCFTPVHGQDIVFTLVCMWIK